MNSSQLDKLERSLIFWPNLSLIAFNQEATFGWKAKISLQNFMLEYA